MIRFLSLIFAFLLTLTACGGDSASGPSQASPVGSWTLSTINGQAMPYLVVGSGANKEEITAGNATINSGGSFSMSLTFRSTVNGAVTTQSEADAGTYTVNGSAISFRFNSDGSSATGSVTGNTLTITDSGAAFVFVR